MKTHKHKKQTHTCKFDSKTHTNTRKHTHTHTHTLYNNIIIYLFTREAGVMSVLDLDVPPSVCVRIDCMPHYLVD